MKWIRAPQKKINGQIAVLSIVRLLFLPTDKTVLNGHMIYKCLFAHTHLKIVCSRRMWPLLFRTPRYFLLGAFGAECGRTATWHGQPLKPWWLVRKQRVFHPPCKMTKPQLFLGGTKIQQLKCKRNHQEGPKWPEMACFQDAPSFGCFLFYFCFCFWIFCLRAFYQ